METFNQVEQIRGHLGSIQCLHHFHLRNLVKCFFPMQENKCTFSIWASAKSWRRRAIYIYIYCLSGTPFLYEIHTGKRRQVPWLVFRDHNCVHDALAPLHFVKVHLRRLSIFCGSLRLTTWRVQLLRHHPPATCYSSICFKQNQILQERRDHRRWHTCHLGVENPVLMVLQHYFVGVSTVCFPSSLQLCGSIESVVHGCLQHLLT